MKLEDIRKQIAELMAADMDDIDFDRLEELKEQEELADVQHQLTFRYSNSIPLAQIQLAAKVIRCMLIEDVYRNNANHVDCPLPDGISDWREIEKLSAKFGCRRIFFIETPNYGRLCYYTERSKGISDLEINLHLHLAQGTLKKLYEKTTEGTLAEADVLANSFILINSAISLFYYRKANEENVFDWNEKYSPCFFDRKLILNFRGMLMEEIVDIVDEAKLNICKQYALKDFAMLTKYLTFWVGLLDVATFPGLSLEQKSVYKALSDYLLRTYANIYIYDIVAESDSVKQSKNTAARDASGNTTRLKIFFTQADNKPQMLRLDLPHEDHQYVHLNHETIDGKNNHIRISEDEKYSGQYDGVFDPLVQTLQLYNFYTITTRHTPREDDTQVFKEMQYLSAMYDYEITVRSYLYLGSNNEIMKSEYSRNARNTLIGLLVADGLKKDELETLNPYDLFKFADDAICMNKWIL